MEEKRNNNLVVVLLVIIILILSAICILFATGTISFNKEKDDINNKEPDSVLINELYEIVGINWNGDKFNGDCLNYYLSNNNYKSNAQKIFSLYAIYNKMVTNRYNEKNCNDECKMAYSCAECTSILKIDAEKILKLYNFENLKFNKLPGFDTDYAYASDIPVGVCHYDVKHDTNTKYIYENEIRITDNQVVTDYAYGEGDKVDSIKNQTVTYDFKKDNNGKYYLAEVSVEGNNLNNKISKQDIKEKFAFVYEYNDLSNFYCGRTEDNIITISEKGYRKSSEFKSYDEMLNYLKKYMSIDLISGKQAFVATNEDNYLEKDKNLYCEETYKGDYHSRNVKDIEIVKEESNKVIFVGNMELVDMGNNVSYDKVNCTIEYIDNNWIITSFEKQNN